MVKVKTKVNQQTEAENEVLVQERAEQTAIVRQKIEKMVHTVFTIGISIVYFTVIAFLAFTVYKSLFNVSSMLEMFNTTYFKFTDGSRQLIVGFVAFGMFGKHFAQNIQNLFNRPKEIAYSLLVLSILGVSMAIASKLFGLPLDTIFPVVAAIFIVVDTVYDFSDFRV